MGLLELKPYGRPSHLVGPELFTYILSFILSDDEELLKFSESGNKWYMTNAWRMLSSFVLFIVMKCFHHEKFHKAYKVKTYKQVFNLNRELQKPNFILIKWWISVNLVWKCWQVIHNQCLTIIIIFCVFWFISMKRKKIHRMDQAKTYSKSSIWIRDFNNLNFPLIKRWSSNSSESVSLWFVIHNQYLTHVFCCFFCFFVLIYCSKKCVSRKNIQNV